MPEVECIGPRNNFVQVLAMLLVFILIIIIFPSFIIDCNEVCES